jgi:hypothetical protein
MLESHPSEQLAASINDTMMTAAVVWATISTIWKSLRDGNVDFGTVFACGLPIFMCIYAFKAFWASK